MHLYGMRAESELGEHIRSAFPPWDYSLRAPE